MKIVYVITRAVHGGAQKNLVDLAKHFKRENKVLVVCGQEGYLTEELGKENIEISVIPEMSNSYDLRLDMVAIKKMLRILEMEKPQIVHCHSTKAGVIGRIAGRMASVPVVFTAHGWAFSEGAKPFRRSIAIVAEALLATITRKVICVSEYDKKLAEKVWKGFQKSKLTRVWNGIQDEKGKNIKRIEEGIIYTMVARFDEPKDQKLIVQNINEICGKVKFVFIGDGPRKNEVMELASKLGVSERAKFLGDRDDVEEILEGSDVFVLSSKHEGLPISVLEAMRAGLPIVASNVGGISEQVDEECGILFEHGNKQEMISALNELAKDGEKRKKMGENSRRAFKKKFLLDEMCRQIKKVYSEAIGQ